MGNLRGGSAVTSAQIVDGEIVNADINASAAIDASKIADGSVSSAEFQRLDGVTSAIQTQIDAKAPSGIGTATTGTYTPTGTVTSTSGTYATPTGFATVSFTTLARPILILLTANLYITTADATLGVGMSIDGGASTDMIGTSALGTGSDRSQISFTLVTTLSAASHTFIPQWKRVAGTGQLNADGNWYVTIVQL